MSKITRTAITVKQAMDYLYYDESIHCEYGDNEYEPMYGEASDLVDNYNILITLIKKRFGGAVGQVNFKVLENYTFEEVNQMIDNYLQEELAA